MSPRSWALLALTLAAAIPSLVPHPLHFVSVGAMAVFAGAVFGNRWLAFATPLLVRLAMDVVVTFRNGDPLDARDLIQIASTYPCLAASTWLGSLLRGRWDNGVKGIAETAGAGAAGWVLFYIVTNFVYWLTAGRLPLTSNGLLTSYVNAIPFLRWQLVGDVFFTTVLFGSWAVLTRGVPSLSEKPEPAVVS